MAGMRHIQLQLFAMAVPALLRLLGFVAVLSTAVDGQTTPLSFLSLGTTQGVTQESLPRVDDGSSSTIPILDGFPFGGTSSYSVYVNNNGYFSFMRSVSYCCPSLFSPGSEEYLVAPFWADNDIRNDGSISYEVHTNGSGLLAQVNSFLTSYTGDVFSGRWMLVAEWLQVQAFASTGIGQPENTFQGVVVTDGSVSYAVFIYNCDQMDWGGSATIGYHAEGDFYENHDLTGSLSANAIACTNSPASLWSNVVYRLTVSAPVVTIRTQPSQPPFQAATRINFACDVDSGLEVTYGWTGYCTSEGGTVQTLSHTTSLAPGEFSAWVSSTTDFCLDVITCTVTDSLGNTEEASYRFAASDVTGVGLWGASESLPTNAAFMADSSGQIGTITCHSAARGSPLRQWVAPSGTDITFDLTDPFVIELHTGSYPSYSSFQLNGGESFASDDQGVYSCVLADENGIEHTLNIGIYPNGYSVPLTISSVQRTSEDPLTVTCASSGKPATTVQWSKGSDSIVSGGTYQTSQSVSDRTTSSYNNMLTIGGNVDVATGIYKCTVSTEMHNSVPTTSRESAQHFFGVYTVGTTEDIRCNEIGAVSITWLYDNDQLVLSADSSSVPFTLVANDSVHHRVYTCRAFRGDGSYSELYLSIIVYVPNSALSLSVSDSGTMGSGEEYSLFCLATKTVSGLANTTSLQWLDEDGSPVTSGGPVTVGEPNVQTFAVSLSLTFSSLHVSHGGRYTCQASLSSPALDAPLVKNTTSDVTLQIPAPAVSLSRPSSGPEHAGGSVTLTCSIQLSDLVDSSVTVTTTWRKDGVVLTSSAKTTISEVEQLSTYLYRSTLTISDLSQSSDAGVYLCEASAAASPSSSYITTSSMASDSLTLTIQGPTLTASLSPASVTVLDASPYNAFSLVCTATTQDNVVTTKSFQWTRKMLGSDTTIVITSEGVNSITDSGLNSAVSTSTLATSLSSSGTYTYTCAATLLQEEGTDVLATSSVNVIVQGPSVPVKPENIGAMVTSFTTAQVQWTVPRIAYTPEQYTVEYGTSPGSLSQSSAVVSGSTDLTVVDRQYSVEVTGLQEGSTYYYRVVAENVQGSTSSNVNSFTVEDIPVIVSISGLTSGVAGGSLTLTCTAIEENDITGTPALSWSGPDGTNLQSGGDITIGTTTTMGTTTSLTLQLSPLRVSHSGEYSCIANISELGFTDNVTHQITITAGRFSVSVSSSGDYLAASPVTLTCEVGAEAVGPITYLWTSSCSGGCFIAGQTSASVATSALKAADSGSHTCTVADSVGSTGAGSIEFNVTGVGLYSSRDGKITDNSLLIAASDGSTGSLQCISETRAPDVGQWLAPNGQDLAQGSSGPFTVTVGGQENPGYVALTLSSPGLTGAEQGVYSCVIPDGDGMDHTIRVGMYPNGFNIPPSIVSLDHGSTAELTFALACVSSGSPAFSVTWSKDGKVLTSGEVYSMSQMLTEGTTSTYENTLSVSAEPRDLDGTYTCRVANTIGADEQSITINGLQITGNSVLILGGSDTLTCSTDLDATVTEWLYDDVVIVSSSGPEAPLVFNLVNDSIHNRDYVCRTTTPYGVQQQSITTLVQVFLDDFDVTIISDSASSHAGQELTLTCTATAVEGLLYPLKVEWLDSSRDVITTSGDITVGIAETSGLTTTTTVRFNPLRLSHAGDIVCRVNISTLVPPYNFSRKAELEQIVTVPPLEAQVDPSSVEALVSESITFLCTATVNDSVMVPKTFQWSRRADGGPATDLTDNGGTVRITNSDLDAPSSTTQLTIVEDSPGVYQLTCTATLQFPGEIDDNIILEAGHANVTITGPSVPTEPVALTVSNVSYESARVTWTTSSIAFTSESHVVVFSTDPMNLVQQSPSVPVTDSGQYSIELEELIPGTTYYFKVAASNSYGSTESEQGMLTTLLKDGAPSAPPSNVVVEASGPTSITISWEPPPADQQNGDVLSYTVSCSPAQITMTYQTAGVWSVGGLRPATTYTCTVHATNTNGNGPAASVTERTADGVPGEVSFISYRSISDYKIELTWGEPLTPNGTIENYIIVVNLYEDADAPPTVYTVSADEGLSNIIPKQFEPYVPYRIFIAAMSSNPIHGPNKGIVAFSKEGVPSVAPTTEESVRLNGTHMNISYTPLTLTQARGFIVHYSVTYEPTLGARRKKRETMSVRVPPEESHIVIEGLSPELQYTVSVSAVTSEGEGPAAEFIVEVPCSQTFQLLLREVHNCNNWRFTGTEDKLSDIAGKILPAVSDHCQCSLSLSSISSGEFRCIEGDLTAVLYRAVLIVGMREECLTVVSHMKDWISSGTASFAIQGNRLQVDPDCTVEIDSLTSETTCPIATTGSPPEDSDITVPIVGAVAGVVVIVVVVILAVVIFVHWLRSRGRYKPPRPRTTDRDLQRTTTPQMELNGAYVPAGNIYDPQGIEFQTLQQQQNGHERVVVNAMYESSKKYPDDYVEMNPAVVRVSESKSPPTGEEHIYDVVGGPRDVQQPPQQSPYINLRTDTL